MDKILLLGYWQATEYRRNYMGFPEESIPSSNHSLLTISMDTAVRPDQLKYSF